MGRLQIGSDGDIGLSSSRKGCSPVNTEREEHEDETEEARDGRIMKRIGLFVGLISALGLALAVHQYDETPLLSLVVGGLCAFILYLIAKSLFPLLP